MLSLLDNYLSFGMTTYAFLQLGTRFLQFSIPHVNATTSVRSQKWSKIVKSEADGMTCKRSQQLHASDQRSNPNTYSWTYNQGNKWFSLLQENDQKIGNQAATEVSFCQPIHVNVVPSGDGMGSHEFDGNTSQTINSNFALYLLSTQPTHTSGIGLSHLMQPNAMVQPVLPLGSGLQVNGMAQVLHSHGAMDELMRSVLVPDAKETNIQHNGMLHVMPDDLLQNGSS